MSDLFSDKLYEHRYKAIEQTFDISFSFPKDASDEQIYNAAIQAVTDYIERRKIEEMKKAQASAIYYLFKKSEE